MTFYKWSQTAASNGTADSTALFPEGMAPSALNDGNRGQMAALAKYRDDTAGAIVTAGTSTAYTVSSYEGFDTLAHLSGQIIAFSPHATNGATVTLNVDGLGAKPLRTAPNAELLAGTIIQGTPYVAVFNNSDGAFYLQGFFGNPYNIPLAGGMDYWGAAVPNSSFAFPIGQAISRTTYAALFTLVGTTYGAGDGSTTFNLPDKTGRVSAMVEATQSRLTPTYFGGDSRFRGGVGGGESLTLSISNINPFTPTGSVSTSTSISGSIPIQGASGSVLTSAAAWGRNETGVVNLPFNTASASSSSTFTGNSLGSGTPHRTVQPTIVCNYILRII